MGGGSGSGRGAIVPHAHELHVSPLHDTNQCPPSNQRNSKSPVSHPPPGLKNVGNTCFANAALQCLLCTPLSHALLDPKTAVIFRSYSSNLNLLRQGSGEVDTDDSSDEDDIFNSIDNVSHFRTSATDDEDKRKRRKERQKRREERLKKREKRDLIEKCGWVTRELKVITREYTRLPSSTDASEGSKSIGQSKGFFSAWSYTPPPPPNPVVDPGQITRHVNKLSRCLRPYQQEDAHEFLRALLSTLIMDGHNKELSSLFDGLLESAVTCKTCRRVSLTRDRYMDLSLDINHNDISSLPEALKAFTATETLDGDNMVNCDRCGVKRTVTKGLRLATAPTVLVCHLKRFAYDMYGRTIRLAKHVEFPLHLDIGGFMSKANRSTPPPYELVGVLVHTGRSCDSGHYLSFVKSGQSWYKCNDAIVTKVSVETVLDQRAYILMYEVAGMREKHGFKSFHKYHEGKTTSTSAEPMTTDVSSLSKRSGDELSWTTHKSSHHSEILSADECRMTARPTRSQSLSKGSDEPIKGNRSQVRRHQIRDDKPSSSGFSSVFKLCLVDDFLDNMCTGGSRVCPGAAETKYDEKCSVVSRSQPLKSSVHPVYMDHTGRGEEERCNPTREERLENTSTEGCSDDEDVSLGGRRAMKRSASSGNFRQMEMEAAIAYQQSCSNSSASEDIGSAQIINQFSQIPSIPNLESDLNTGRPRSKSMSRLRPSASLLSSLTKPKPIALETSSQKYRTHTRSPTNIDMSNDTPDTIISCRDKLASRRRPGNLPPLHRKK